LNQKKKNRPRALMTTTPIIPITMLDIVLPERLEDGFWDAVGAGDVAAAPALPAAELEPEGDAAVGLDDVVRAGAEIVGFDEAEEAGSRTTTLGLEICSLCSLVKR
jgi:hypothetical protein